MTVSEQYASLPNIGAAVLEMMARNADVILTSEEAKRALEPMLTLPSFPDVRPGLGKLKQHGFRLATLTNSSQAGVNAQMEHAGLTDCFEQQLAQGATRGASLVGPDTLAHTLLASVLRQAPTKCARAAH